MKILSAHSECALWLQYHICWLNITQVLKVSGHPISGSYDLGISDIRTIYESAISVIS